MSLKEFQSPIIISGPAVGNSGGNPDASPSLIYGGAGLFDPRFTYRRGGQGNGSPVALGWVSAGRMVVVDQVPSTLTTTAIAAAQVPVAATPLTLVSSTGAGITVLAAATTVQPSGTVIPVGALAIDGAPGVVSMGLSGACQFYDPTKAIARNIQIASVGDDRTATFTVTGNDIFGYPMTETITGANTGATAAGKKAFKFVRSITPAGTPSGSNVSVGQGDTFGFPLYVPSFIYADIVWNAAVIAAQSTGTFTYGVTTNPATSTTGDVRGTWLASSASDNTKRLQISLSVATANINTSTGLTGITQA